MEHTPDMPITDRVGINDSTVDSQIVEELGELLTDPSKVFNLLQYEKIQQYIVNTPLERIVIHFVMIIISFCGIRAQSNKILYCVKMLFWKIKKMIDGIIQKYKRSEETDIDKIIQDKIDKYSKSIETMIAHYNNRCAQNENALSFSGLDNFVQSLKNEFNIKIAEMERRYDELRWRCEALVNHNMNSIMLSQNTDEPKQEKTYVFDEASIVQYSRD
uniref:NSP4 n=1 Tax=Porcine rotavirus H TaxID=1420855 RepID=A0A0A0WDL8_9REOV|nr:NSP4 [Porcine rotavirus H]AIW80077.1 NSP4 [Porcine rotavirus H]